jgi:hypothetical protein
LLPSKVFGRGFQELNAVQNTTFSCLFNPASLLPSTQSNRKTPASTPDIADEAHSCKTFVKNAVSDGLSQQSWETRNDAGTGM